MSFPDHTIKASSSYDGDRHFDQRATYRITIVSRPEAGFTDEVVIGCTAGDPNTARMEARKRLKLLIVALQKAEVEAERLPWEAPVVPPGEDLARGL